MKLLIVSQYFYPEQFGVNDISSKLAALGHDVTVLTGLPNYPMGEIYDGYQWEQLKNQTNPTVVSKGEYHRELDAFVEEINGVRVIRCRLHPRNKGKKSLMINYLSFAYHASKVAGNLVKSAESEERLRFDRVLVTQYSPVTMATPATIIKRKLKIPFILYCFDLWPESIVSAGLKNHGFFYRVIKMISRIIYTKADKIIISSRNFEKYLRGKLNVTAPITYIPMYAEDVFANRDMEPSLVSKLAKPSACNLMFAGNIGKMQSIDTVIKAASELKDAYHRDPSNCPGFPVIFHMVGNGSALEVSIEHAKELGVFLSESQYNSITKSALKDFGCGIVFHGRHPVKEMPGFYSIADAMLITLKKDDVISYTLPNKVQTYMAAGKPIIAAIDGEASSVIMEAGCGLVCRAEDHSALANNILAFAEALSNNSGGGAPAEADSECIQYGNNSRSYYEKHFSADNFIKSLLLVLE